MKNKDVQYAEYKGRKVFVASKLDSIYRLAKYYGIKEATPVFRDGQKSEEYILLIPEPFDNFYLTEVFLDRFVLIDICIN